MLFVQDSMQIDPILLPDDSPYYGYAFNQAIATVLSVPSCGGIDYTLAVYNCGGHILLRITPDQPQRTFFQDTRGKYAMLQPSVGVVQSASDDGTANTIAVPKALQELTIGDLGFMKTPWGREYLSYAQDFGGIWGLT